MMSTLTPRRYALALYEVAEETKSLESVEKDMARIRDIFDRTPQVRDYCLRIHGDRRFDMDFIETAFFPYVGKYTKEMLRIAVKNGRLLILPFLPHAFAMVGEEKNNTVTVKIETAHTFTGELISLLSQKMRKRIKKDIKIKTMVNPALLGGFRILWQNKIIDQSVAGRLKKIRAVMVNQI